MSERCIEISYSGKDALTQRFIRSIGELAGVFIVRKVEERFSKDGNQEFLVVTLIMQNMTPENDGSSGSTEEDDDLAAEEYRRWEALAEHIGRIIVNSGLDIDNVHICRAYRHAGVNPDLAWKAADTIQRN